MNLHPVITDEALDRLRERIGLPVKRSTPPFYSEINVDAARHYANGIGDNNPLYNDPAYGEASFWKRSLATPTILYSTNNEVGGAVEGLPGVHAMFAGTDFTWHRPVEVGTRIRTESKLKDLVEKQTRFAGRSIQQIYTVKFFNQIDDLIAEADSWCFRVGRSEAKKGEKYAHERNDEDREKRLAKWTKDDRERFAQHYAQERRRGAQTRFAEDVQVGDALDTLLKGPYTITTVIAYFQAWGSYGTQSHRNAWDYFARHPTLAIPNKYGVPEGPARVHWDEDFAREAGIPAPYDFGPERISWLSHALTDWMGDAGHLRRLNAKVRDHNLVGDVAWINGTVTGKSVVENQHRIAIELWAENQFGDKTATGQAEVVLPSRGTK